MQMIVENSKTLVILYSQIDKDQKPFLIKFKEEEETLKIKLSEIDQLKLILNNEELQKEIDIYNDLLNKLNIKVDSFNSHYDNQINKLKNIIITNILKILEAYSFKNEIDLILDSNNYILSNNLINITDLILSDLNEIIIETNFEKYK